MFALIYISLANTHFEEDDIYALEKSSCSNNERLNVTGYLNYKKGKFLQYLEGEKDVVLKLMQTISEDYRHTVIKVMLLPDIENRRFANCYMRYWTYDELVQIKMDDMLENVLLGMNEKIYGENALQKRVLQLVSRMAEVHKLYPQTSGRTV